MVSGSQGQKTRRRPRALSEYGRQLAEKQKLKNLYNLKETQFRKYAKEVLSFHGKKEKDVSELLISVLESRLDNVVFRLGFAISRPQARQLVSHGHFLVNRKSVNIPSFRLKKGDVVKLKSKSLKKRFFQNIVPGLKKQKPPSWLTLDIENLEAKIIGEPTLKEAAPPVEMPVIFEYYSR